MSRNTIVKKILLIIPAIIIVCLTAFGAFYGYWNTASPDRTCGSCHEIGSSVDSQARSSHRNLQCKECHGTALRGGFHSTKEKGMMVVNHLKSKSEENIRLGEEQMLEVLNNCRRCHTSEFADWSSGGHSIDYGHVFLNTKHNSTEQINFDCLRCHGMFFKGTVKDIVEPLNIKGPWKLLDSKRGTMPAIPCMACHQIHQDGAPHKSPDYAGPKSIFYQKQDSGFVVGFYDRHEKSYVSIAQLPGLNLWEGERPVKVSDDPIMRNCVQCHAPNASHEAGTGDDRTPRGVHEGLSCMSCHELHSNNSKNSCKSCHPAISNCKLDVRRMNTSYADAKSPNNIHFVACTDCHKEEKRSIKIKLKKSKIQNYKADKF
jgi:hypothetical protein